MIWLDLMTCSKILLHPPLIYPVASLKANIPAGYYEPDFRGQQLGALSYPSHLFLRSQSRKTATLPELKRKCWNMHFWWRESLKPSYGSKGCHGAGGGGSRKWMGCVEPEVMANWRIRRKKPGRGKEWGAIVGNP